MKSYRSTHVLKLPCYRELDGDLVAIENNIGDFFCIKRIFYIYNVPKNECRADHASKNTDFLMIAISGCVNICIDNGYEKKMYYMKSRDKGLYVPCNNWIRVHYLSEEAVLLVLANTKYNESVYYKDYREFLDRNVRD